MYISLLLIALALLLVASASWKHLFQKHKSKNKLEIPIIIISMVNLFLGAISFMWATRAIPYSQEHMVFILSFLIVIQTISLIFILSKIQKNKKIAYSLFLLLIGLIPSILNKNYFHIIIPISFLITIMTFLTFTEDHKSHISLLIGYSSLSLILYVLTFINQNLIILFLTISTAMFLIFYTEFLKFLKKPHLISTNNRRKSPIIPFLKHLIFIIIITNFIFVGTVSVHELGHIISIKSSGCSDSKIVYDLETFPHTEVKCDDVSSRNKWIWSGILLPIIIALLLIFGGGKSIKEIGLEIIGFNFAISYLDLQILGFPKSIAIVVAGAGLSMSVLGLALLANSRTNHF